MKWWLLFSLLLLPSAVRAALKVEVTLAGLPDELKTNALAYLRLDDGDIADERQ